MNEFIKALKRAAVLIASALVIFDGWPRLLNFFDEYNICHITDGSISFPFLSNYLTVIRPSILLFGLIFFVLLYMYLKSLRSGNSHSWFDYSNVWFGSLTILFGCIATIFVQLHVLSQPISFSGFIGSTIILLFISWTTSATIKFMKYKFNS